MNRGLGIINELRFATQRSGRTSGKVSLAFAGDDDARVPFRGVTSVQNINTPGKLTYCKSGLQPDA
jgi:hypothetical protein